MTKYKMGDWKKVTSSEQLIEELYTMPEFMDVDMEIRLLTVCDKEDERCALQFRHPEIEV